LSGPTAPTDVLPGSEPFAFPGGSGPDGRTGVLLVHGFTGTPMSMRPWGEHLAAEGFAVRCPLLPGHGTSWQDCNVSTHDQWTTAVGEAFDALAQECDRVFVAGLSMGGTLATRLAEVRPDDMAGLLLVNPAFLTQRLDAKLLPLIARLTGSWAPIASDIKKPGVIELAYPKLPTRAMMQLRRLWAATRADLAKVTAPVIVFHSREDHVVEPVNTQVLLAAISSADKDEVVLENSYHVATLDNDAPQIFAGSVDWIRARVPASGAPAESASADDR
jgi:carboxylesterase